MPTRDTDLPALPKSLTAPVRIWTPVAAFFVVAVGCGDSSPLTGPEPGSGDDAGIPAETAPSVTDLGGLGGATTVAEDVNAAQQVVGTAESADGHQRAFLWEDGEIRDLGTLGGSWSTAGDINDWGQVAGTSVTAAGEARAFFWSDEEMYEIGTLGGRESYGVAINDLGQVAGYSTTADGEMHAFLWSKGRIHDLGTLGNGGSFTAAVNDRGDVVGRSITDGGRNDAFRWSGGEIAGVSPERTRSSSAVDVSGEGHVLVNSRAGGRGVAHIWHDGRVTQLESGSGGSAVAADVNARGRAVGQVSSDGDTRAVVWRHGPARALYPPGFAGSGTATAINDAGQVTGAVRPGEAAGHRAFLWEDGRLQTLDPELHDRRPESSAGVAVAEGGTVVGLATHAAGEVRSFVWIPAADESNREISSGDEVRGAVSRQPTAGRDAPAAPFSSDAPLVRALEALSAERPELALPGALEALHRK